MYRTRSDWNLYEEILPDTPILPSPFEAKAQKQEKEPETITKVVDSTSRAELTMPRSPIIGDSTERKSPPQLEKESSVSTIAKEIKQEKERERGPHLLWKGL